MQRLNSQFPSIVSRTLFPESIRPAFLAWIQEFNF